MSSNAPNSQAAGPEERVQSGGRRRPGAGRLLVFLAVIMLGLAVGAELTARVAVWAVYPPHHPVRARAVQLQEARWTQFDRELGWTNRPGARAEDVFGEGDVTINAAGLRSLREYEPTPPEGTRRVLAVGDSFTFGYELGDGLDWPAQLEAMTLRGEAAGIEVPNLGVCAYSLGQAVLRYERWAGQLEYDMVVLGLFAWDVNRSITARSHHGLAQPKFAVRGGQAEAVNLPLGDEALKPRVAGGPLMLGRLLMDRREGRERLRFIHEPEASESWRVGRALLARMRDAAEAHGARLLVVEIPDYGQLGGDAAVNEFAGGIARELGIDYVSLYPVFRAAADPLALYVGAHGHCSAEGNRVIAQTVREYLEQSR